MKLTEALETVLSLAIDNALPEDEADMQDQAKLQHKAIETVQAHLDVLGKKEPLFYYHVWDEDGNKLFGIPVANHDEHTEVRATHEYFMRHGYKYEIFFSNEAPTVLGATKVFLIPGHVIFVIMSDGQPDQHGKIPDPFDIPMSCKAMVQVSVMIDPVIYPVNDETMPTLANVGEEVYEKFDFLCRTPADAIELVEDWVSLITDLQ